MNVTRGDRRGPRETRGGARRKGRCEGKWESRKGTER